MSRKHALVVDDEFLILLDIEATLRSEGYDVSLAASVAEASAIMENEKVDLAIIDYWLRDGCCQALARRLQTAGVPFVVCSGEPSLGDLGSVFADVPFLSKPFTTADLLAAVRAIMQAQQLYVAP